MEWKLDDMHQQKQRLYHLHHHHQLGTIKVTIH